jgi:hypothetical protein
MRPGLRRQGSPSTHPQVFRRDLAPVFCLFVADLGALVERAQASALDGRDVHEHIFAAVLRLNEPVSLGRVEPFHSTDRHVSILPGVIKSRSLRRPSSGMQDRSIAAGSTWERIGINDAPAPRRSEKQLPRNEWALRA